MDKLHDFVKRIPLLSAENSLKSKAMTENNS